MELIDSHCHIDLGLFAANFTEVLAQARQVGVVAQVLPGVSRAGWQRILELCGTEQDLYPAIGLHPMYLQAHQDGDLEALELHAQAGQLLAIGEIGLDYFVRDCDRRAQQRLFEDQIGIAAAAGLPVLLHVRKAHDQVQAILRRCHFGHGGIVHAFSGSLQQADQYLKLGFMISICGTITYDRATKIRAVAAQLPLTTLVLETDSPDIPPAPYHGQSNRPAYLPCIMESLAGLRKESPRLVAQQTTANVRKVLGMGSESLTGGTGLRKKYGVPKELLDEPS